MLLLYLVWWTIKARITSKREIRCWSCARGEAVLFSVGLWEMLMETKFKADSSRKALKNSTLTWK
jgi:hypothetical protein